MNHRERTEQLAGLLMRSDEFALEIEQALAAVERETLERAAVVVGDMPTKVKHELPGVQPFWCPMGPEEARAKAVETIRSLVSIQVTQPVEGERGITPNLNDRTGSDASASLPEYVATPDYITNPPPVTYKAEFSETPSKDSSVKETPGTLHKESLNKSSPTSQEGDVTLCAEWESAVREALAEFRIKMCHDEDGWFWVKEEEAKLESGQQEADCVCKRCGRAHETLYVSEQAPAARKAKAIDWGKVNWKAMQAMSEGEPESIGETLTETEREAAKFHITHADAQLAGKQGFLAGAHWEASRSRPEQKETK